jgi:hypothetical protein
MASSKPVKGIPEYSKVLPQDMKPFCNVCHLKNSGGPLNSFGEDYDVFHDRLASLMEMDSDSDGYSNGDELDAGVFPGNPKSYPGKQEKNSILIAVSILPISISAIIILRLVKNRV